MSKLFKLLGAQLLYLGAEIIMVTVGEEQPANHTLRGPGTQYGILESSTQHAADQMGAGGLRSLLRQLGKKPGVLHNFSTSLRALHSLPFAAILTSIH